MDAQPGPGDGPQPGPGDGGAQPVGPQWDPSYLPPFFKGNAEEDFNQWCRKLEIAVQNYPTGAPPLANALPSRLDGKAFTFWDSLPVATRENFDLAKNALARVFGRTSQMRKIRDFSLSRPRLPKEPLEIYAAAIREMVNTAFAGDYDYGPHFREHEYLRRFLTGLEPDMQMKCREHGPQNLNEALAIAQRLEFAQSTIKTQQPSFTQDTVSAFNSNSPKSVRKKQDSELSELMDQLSLLNKRLDRLEDTRNAHFPRRSESPYRRRSNSISPSRRNRSYRSPSPRERYDRRRSVSPVDRDRDREYDRPSRRDSYDHRKSSPDRMYRDNDRFSDSPRRARARVHWKDDEYHRDSGNDKWSPKRIDRRPNWTK